MTRTSVTITQVDVPLGSVLLFRTNLIHGTGLTKSFDHMRVAVGLKMIPKSFIVEPENACRLIRQSINLGMNNEALMPTIRGMLQFVEHHCGFLPSMNALDVRYAFADSKISTFEMDAQLDVVSNLSSFESDLRNLLELTSKARANADSVMSSRVRYGPTLAEYVDVFPSKTVNSPVVVFIHGGWWVSQSAEDFSLVSSAFPQCTVVVVNYALSPKVDISEITRQIRAAVVWVNGNISNYNGDNSKIFVVGHSCGGHSAAMLLKTEWERDYGLSSNVIKGAVAISGVFDLHPLLQTSFLDNKLQLSRRILETQNLVAMKPPDWLPLTLVVGLEESKEFHRQSEALKDAWQLPKVNICKGNHVSIVSSLADANSDIVQLIQALIDKNAQ